MGGRKARIAVVTGASRGIGRGIAHELGCCGFTVYVTGRSTSGKPTTDDLPGTIDETARLVTESGGEGIAVECDHTDDAAVQRLADRVTDRHGELDLLVNNVWGGYEDYTPELWELPVGEQPIERWDKMMATGVRAHYATTRVLIPILRRVPNPTIVNISFGDEGRFLGDVQYDVAKAAITRLGFALASKLKKEGITALTVYPGFTRTERVERGASKEELSDTHTPRFVGRAVVALANDPDVLDLTGEAIKVGHLAQKYGFVDIDGRRHEPYSLPEGFGT